MKKLITIISAIAIIFAMCVNTYAAAPKVVESNQGNDKTIYIKADVASDNTITCTKQNGQPSAIDWALVTITPNNALVPKAGDNAVFMKIKVGSKDMLSPWVSFNNSDKINMADAASRFFSVDEAGNLTDLSGEKAVSVGWYGDTLSANSTIYMIGTFESIVSPDAPATVMSGLKKSIKSVKLSYNTQDTLVEKNAWENGQSMQILDVGYCTVDENLTKISSTNGLLKAAATFEGTAATPKATVAPTEAPTSTPIAATATATIEATQQATATINATSDPAAVTVGASASNTSTPALTGTKSTLSSFSIIPTIIVVAVVVLLGAGAAIYFITKNKKK